MIERLATRSSVLVGLGIVLLLAAWVPSTQPWGGPDEASHYQRAYSIVNGKLLGPKIDYTTVMLTASQRAFIDHDTRAVLMPARMSPSNVLCETGRPDLRGSCIEEDPNGNFPPLPYLLPAAALAVSNHASTAFWLGRVASALPSLGLLLLAAALMWGGSGLSLLGLLAAISPMVLFSSSLINSSGAQITSCLAFAAAGLRLSRAPAWSPGWVWAAFAGTGAAAILSGPIGLEFVLFELVVLAIVVGRDGIGELRGARALVPSAAVLVVAAAVAIVYSRVAGFSAHVGFTPIGQSLRAAVGQLGIVLRDAVGTFGMESVHLSKAADAIWWLLVLALLGGACVLGTRRERVSVLVVLALSLAFPVLFYAWVVRFSGFGLQGREVLPPLLMIPLVAGEVVYRHRGALARRRWVSPAVGTTVAVIAAFQAYAWWANARVVAGAPGTIRFYAHAIWKPPGGWGLWIALAALGALSLLAFGLLEAAQRFSATNGAVRLNTTNPSANTTSTTATGSSTAR